MRRADWQVGMQAGGVAGWWAGKQREYACGCMLTEAGLCLESESKSVERFVQARHAAIER